MVQDCGSHLLAFSCALWVYNLCGLPIALQPDTEDSIGQDADALPEVGNMRPMLLLDARVAWYQFALLSVLLHACEACFQTSLCTLSFEFPFLDSVTCLGATGGRLRLHSGWVHTLSLYMQGPFTLIPRAVLPTW